MDIIRTPDLNNLDSRQSKSLNTYDRYTRAEDNTGKIRADFDRATVVQDYQIKSKEPEKSDAEKLVDEFSAKRRTVAADALNKGVKVRGAYVARKHILRAIIIVIVLFVAGVLFLPPFYKSNDTMSSCRSEDIFGAAGSTQYKADLLNDHYVYNIDAMTSDRSDSYRICTIAFDAKNYSPFEVYMDDYIISDGGDYSSNIVYSTYVGDSNVIPAFSTKTVQIEILIKRDGLSDEDFDKAITSLTLHSKGAKKRISKKTGLPCIPAWLSVSDVISFDPD